MVTYFYFIIFTLKPKFKFLCLSCAFIRNCYKYMYIILKVFFPKILGSAYWNLPTIVPVIQQLIKILNR